MTNPAPRTMQLAPAHWRQLALLNVEQLHRFITDLPAHTEAGSGMTAEAMAIIDQHLAEQAAFLRAWRVARLPGVAVQPDAGKANGVGEPAKAKRKGWPLGKKRGPRKQVGARQ